MEFPWLTSVSDTGDAGDTGVTGVTGLIGAGEDGGETCGLVASELGRSHCVRRNAWFT